jgi:aldehyde dehydrogenase (NAD+)
VEAPTTTQSFISGESVASPQVYDNIDPSTGQSLCGVARGGADEIDRAVKAARRAFGTWRSTTPAERATRLTGIADLIERCICDTTIAGDEAWS